MIQQTFLAFQPAILMVCYWKGLTLKKVRLQAPRRGGQPVLNMIMGSNQDMPRAIGVTFIVTPMRHILEVRDAAIAAGKKSGIKQVTLAAGDHLTSVLLYNRGTSGGGISP